MLIKRGKLAATEIELKANRCYTVSTTRDLPAQRTLITEAIVTATVGTCPLKVLATK